MKYLLFIPILLLSFCSRKQDRDLYILHENYKTIKVNCHVYPDAADRLEVDLVRHTDCCKDSFYVAYFYKAVPVNANGRHNQSLLLDYLGATGDTVEFVKGKWQNANGN